MLVSMRKFFAEKGQGLTEYVLILAFVAGIAGTFAWLGTDYRPQDTNYERRDGVGPGALHIGHE